MSGPPDQSSPPADLSRTPARPPVPLPTLDDPEDLFPPPQPVPPEHGELLPPHPPERSVVKRIVYIVVGLILILIGTVLWITPIIGGAPLFWIPGFIFLAKASDPVRRFINFGDSKLPGKLRSLLRWARDKTPGSGASSNSPPTNADEGHGAQSAKNDETVPASRPPSGDATPNA